MDDPLIFGYQLSGVKTFYVTQEDGGCRVLDVPVLPGAIRGGDPEDSEGEVFLNHTAEKSIERSCLTVRTGIRHR
jgi:hypothetical protein